MVFGRHHRPANDDWRSRATQDLFRDVLCVLLVRSAPSATSVDHATGGALARRQPGAKLVYVTKRAWRRSWRQPHLTDVVTLEPGEPMRHLARRCAPSHDARPRPARQRPQREPPIARCAAAGLGTANAKAGRARLIGTKLDAYAGARPAGRRALLEAARRLDTQPDGGRDTQYPLWSIYGSHKATAQAASTT